MRVAAYITIAVLASISQSACGGGASHGGSDNYANISGEVLQEGQSSYSVVLIKADDGHLYMVQSSELGDELRNLVGMRVAARGPITGEMEGVPIVALDWYDLLPLPSGERPVVGWVRNGGYIVTENEVVWKLQGDFGDLLATFVGSKVWVIGVIMQRMNTSEGSYRVLDVTDYGVIHR
jgi:hypothetical protein